jgi:hypothetical protein
VLERVQKKAVGIVRGLQGTIYEETLDELGLTTLRERQHQADMLEVFKIMAGKDHLGCACWFSRAAVGVVHTRQAAGLMNVVKPRARLDMRQHFFSVRAVNNWNNIPHVIKMAKSLGHLGQNFLKVGAGAGAETNSFGRP